MSADPLREAMESGDTCEVGRLLMERHRELLASFPPPDPIELLGEDGKPLDYASLSHGF